MFDGRTNPAQSVRRELVRILLERIQGEGIEDAAGSMTFDPDNIPGSTYEVEEFLNRPYMNKTEVPLAMDVFVPKMEEGVEKPMIVNIHGGGLVVGDRKMSRAYSHVLASRGYIVFSIEYRLAPRANVSEQLDDVCAGMDAIGRHLVRFDIDFDRIFLTADSAGAYLAIYTAAMKRSKRLQETIGYEPTRMVFRALGLISGMFYTNLNDPLGFLLADQFYGNSATSPEFLELMNPEHHEIVRNLPPTFLITSRGDFLNNYSIMYHKALRDAGKTTKLVYYGESELGHAFVSADPTHPQSIDAIDRMLAWFDERANDRIRVYTQTAEQKACLARVEERMESHEITQQKSWKLIRELNSTSDSRLDEIALRDSRRTYTYRQMFRKWERFAEVYSALGIGEAAGSRVGVLGVSGLEPTFAFYALNMVGASVSMLSPIQLTDMEGLLKSIEFEKITDLVVSDLFAQPLLMTRLLAERERLGLRNIIVMKSPYGGRLGDDRIEAFCAQNYLTLKRTQGLLFMDDLLRKYEATPIAYATSDNDEAAVIVHATGATRGMHKPIPLSDFGLNEGAYRILRSKISSEVGPGDVCLLNVELSFCYAMVDMLHLPLAFGAQVAAVPLSVANPRMSRAFAHYGVNYALLPPFMLDQFGRECVRPDLSSVKMPIVVDKHVQASELGRYNDYLRACGSKSRILNGYGRPEAGGALLVSDAEHNENTMGNPLPNVEIRLLDQADGTYHDLSEGPRRGVLCVSTPSMSSGRLGDVELFSFDEVDSTRWLNTGDLVELNDDGSLTYVGRSNKQAH